MDSIEKLNVRLRFPEVQRGSVRYSCSAEVAKYLRYSTFKFANDCFRRL